MLPQREWEHDCESKRRRESLLGSVINRSIGNKTEARFKVQCASLLPTPTQERGICYSESDKFSLETSRYIILQNSFAIYIISTLT